MLEPIKTMGAAPFIFTPENKNAGALNSMGELIQRGEIDVILTYVACCVGVNFFTQCVPIMTEEPTNLVDYLQMCGRAEREDYQRDRTVMLLIAAEETLTQEGLEKSLLQKFFDKAGK